MNSRKYYIIESTLKQMIAEAPAQETDNAPMDAESSLFTPAEKMFLGKFDARGTTNLGIIYSVSDIGIREFIARSGKDLNLTPRILLSLLKRKVIKLVPYTGWGRNNDYTIELQLDLDDIKGLGDEERKSIESGSGAAGAPPAEASAEATPPPPAPPTEVSWVVKYGDILKESVNIAKNLMLETKNKKASSKKSNYIEKTRIMDDLPTEYVRHIERFIKLIARKTKTAHQKERVIADILDILQMKLNLTSKQIQQSYEFHKSQKRLQQFLEKK